MAIVEQIKLLGDHHGAFIEQVEQSRNFYTGNRADYEQRLELLYNEKMGVEKKIDSLFDSLAELGGSSAKANVAKRIEQMNGECRAIEAHIQELKELTSQHTLSNI